MDLIWLFHAWITIILLLNIWNIIIHDKYKWNIPQTLIVIIFVCTPIVNLVAVLFVLDHIIREEF